MEEIKKCFDKWARLTAPNNNLSHAYVKKSRNDIIVLRSIPDVDMEWKAVTAYYARYHAITALLAKIGIECKDHNCSIKIAEFLLGGMLPKKLFADLKTAKRHRIDLQYYTDRPVEGKEFEKNLDGVNFFVDNSIKVLESLTREDIEKLREKLSIGGSKK